jgi:hypothetical protein
VLLKLKLVFIGLARRNIFLTKSRDSIHTRRYKQTVPVNTGAFRKLVRHVNAHTVSLHSLDRWAVDLAIESPTISAKAGCEFVINFFSDEMKYFDASNHFIRERRSVRCDYRSIVFTRFTRRILLPICRRIPPYIVGTSGRLPNRLCSLNRASSSAERGYASNDSCLRKELTTRYHNLVWNWLKI